MLRAFMGTLAVLIAASGQAQGLVLEAEILEGSADIALPGLTPNQVRYVLLHHKHQKDQATLAAWLRGHADARVSFQTLDGTVHPAILQRLKHCFGRGLLLYTDPVRLEAKAVIRLRLEAPN
jgi:hypothetical protein